MHAQPTVALRDVSFSYNVSPEPLFSQLSVTFPRGFTGIVGANGAGKSTLLRLLVGELSPSSGIVEGAGDAMYCAQRTDAPPHSLSSFLESWEGDACELRGRLEVGTDYLARWPTLSHGERKRAQIAHALWQSPSVLAIDEPTNHIDADARALLLSSLQRFRGVGLIVSHDRAFLDSLCTQILWLEPPVATRYPGSFTEAQQRRQEARESAVRTREKLANESKRLQREAAKRRQSASREHQARSKRGLSGKDSDAREKIDRARVTDGGAGGQLRQMDSRLAKADARLAAATVIKEHTASIWLEGSSSPRDWVLKLAAGQVAMDGQRSLAWPDVIIEPLDRIALTGPNGSGKSTFLRHALTRLNVPQDRVIYLPQEITAEQAREALDQACLLPKAQLGQVMSIVSRLNSRPERLLDSHQPSPGEVRKLLIALGMAQHHHVIVMDEPTNHLDLPSIEALERALCDCPCALLLVSHDAQFLANVGAQTWAVKVTEPGRSAINLPNGPQ